MSNAPTSNTRLKQSQASAANASAASDPKRAFETALSQMQHSGEAASRSRTPIAIRRPEVDARDQASEKRALTEAAHALALLWKISPSMAR